MSAKGWNVLSQRKTEVGSREGKGANPVISLNLYSNPEVCVLLSVCVLYVKSQRFREGKEGDLG